MYLQSQQLEGLGRKNKSVTPAWATQEDPAPSSPSFPLFLDLSY